MEAARRGGAKIMVAYRLHFEPANLAAIEAIRSERIGPPRYFAAQFSMQVKEGNIRTKRELGGGPVFDLGIYCINAARQVFGVEPVSVSAEAARPEDPRFRDVEEMTTVTMRFPQERLAQFVCSFGMFDVSQFQIWGTQGSEGIADIRVIEAIYRSIEQGKSAEVERGGRETGDTLVHRQGNKVPPHPKPELVRAEGPSD
jgi:predicted dehydrogenase